MKQSLPNLDGLRAIAILPVLGLHASYGFLRGGFLGVDLFFVLSGFLITRSLYQEFQETATINLRFFYARRALRLLPATIATLVLAAVLWPFTATAQANLPVAALSVVFYFSNFIDPRVLGTLSSAWSLAIALLGLLHLFRGRKQPIICCLLTAILFVVFFRSFMYHYFPQSLDLYRFTLSRVDSLIAGAISAFLVTHHQRTNLRIYRFTVVTILSLFVIAIFACPPTSSLLFYGGFTITAFVFAALVVALSQMPPTSLLSHPMMIWIGRRSYGLSQYLWPWRQFEYQGINSICSG
jgi:peptidoglycan/LPS O-acetylase OafA/YrhL